MNLVKTSTALALVAAFTAPAMAADEINFYGKANVSVQISDEGGETQTEVKSNASRIGITGYLKVSDNLAVVYKAEVQDEMTDDDKDNIKGRNQYVGLKGNFGTVLLGRNDTMLKQSQGKVDLFSDYEADINSLWKGENRAGETVSYLSPSISGFKFGATYVAEGDDDQIDTTGDAGYSATVMYGDAKLKKSKFYAAVAVDSEVAGYDIVRVTGQTKLGNIVVGAMIQTQEEVGSGDELDGFMVSAKYQINKFTIKGQLQTADIDGGDELSGFTAGVDYSLAKNAKLYSWYSTFDMDSAEDESYLAAGIEYKF